jgi:hypothetical protein
MSGRRTPPALRHGLTSSVVVLPSEDATVYDLFEHAWMEELEPVGSLETWLAHRVVTAAWRLARVERLEGALNSRPVVEALEDPPRPPEPEVEVRRGRSWKLPSEHRYDGLAKLARHEAAIERVFFRALHELQDVQAARKARPKSRAGFRAPERPA